MSTVVSAKRCPACGKMAVLHAEECSACGHLFRTRFAEPENRTEAFDAVMLPRLPVLPVLASSPVRRVHPLQTFSAAFLSSFLLVAALGGVLWFFWGVGAPPPAPNTASTPAALYADAHGPLRAEELYAKISLSMSLYDLDQAAGGTGRILHSSRPHRLNLSYDFPDQSVRVSLSRTDPVINDYRVQAVALYRGGTLLQRHSDDE